MKTKQPNCDTNTETTVHVKVNKEQVLEFEWKQDEKKDLIITTRKCREVLVQTALGSLNEVKCSDINGGAKMKTKASSLCCY